MPKKVSVIPARQDANLIHNAYVRGPRREGETSQSFSQPV